MKLPAYGKELLAARQAGAKPAQPVIVTDSWKLAQLYRESDIFALVCVQASEPYDFGLLYGLDVMLMLRGDDVLGISERIALARPERFSVLLRTDLFPVLSSLWDRLKAQKDPKFKAAHFALAELAAFEAA